MTAAFPPTPNARRTMGPIRVAVVVLIVLVILTFEYDWLTTPWWQKAQRYCGSVGLSGMLRDIVRWFGW